MASTHDWAIKALLDFSLLVFGEPRSRIPQICLRSPPQNWLHFAPPVLMLLSPVSVPSSPPPQLCSGSFVHAKWLPVYSTHLKLNIPGIWTISSWICTIRLGCFQPDLWPRFTPLTWTFYQSDRSMNSDFPSWHLNASILHYIIFTFYFRLSKRMRRMSWLFLHLVLMVWWVSGSLWPLSGHRMHNTHIHTRTHCNTSWYTHTVIKWPELYLFLRGWLKPVMSPRVHACVCAPACVHGCWAAAVESSDRSRRLRSSTGRSSELNT